MTANDSREILSQKVCAPLSLSRGITFRVPQFSYPYSPRTPAISVPSLYNLKAEEPLRELTKKKTQLESCLRHLGKDGKKHFLIDLEGIETISRSKK